MATGKGKGKGDGAAGGSGGGDALRLLGPAGALAAVAALYALPRLYARWRTTAEERRARLPGDAIVPDPRSGYTLAATIEAPPEAVWPWLVQMGQGRGGFYTHEWLETLLGTDVHNADDIVPALQDLSVGDTIRLTPDPYFRLPAQKMTVAEIQPPRSLVLWQTLPTGGVSTWAFELRPQGEKATRLLMRRRGSRPSLFDRVLSPGYVMMDQGVLQGVKRRVEGARAVAPASPDPAAEGAGA